MSSCRKQTLQKMSAVADSYKAVITERNTFITAKVDEQPTQLKRSDSEPRDFTYTFNAEAPRRWADIEDDDDVVIDWADEVGLKEVPLDKDSSEEIPGTPELYFAAPVQYDGMLNPLVLRQQQGASSRQPETLGTPELDAPPILGDCIQNTFVHQEQGESLQPQFSATPEPDSASSIPGGGWTQNHILLQQQQMFCWMQFLMYPQMVQRSSMSQGTAMPADHHDNEGERQASREINSKNERNTSVAIWNIPNNMTRQELRVFLDQNGFAHLYDFLYLPFDFETGANLGYAFVNLKTRADAERFIICLNGERWPRIQSQKVCKVVWNEQTQGLHANIERFRNSPVMHTSVPEEFKPLVFENGVIARLPKPTKRLRPPSKSK